MVNRDMISEIHKEAALNDKHAKEAQAKIIKPYDVGELNKKDINLERKKLLKRLEGQKK